jgi:hypothetical protein
VVLSDALKSLLREAYSYSEEALSEISDKSYDQIPHLAFNGINFPFIELKPFSRNLVLHLRKNNLIEKNSLIRVRRFAGEAVLGTQIYYPPSVKTFGYALYRIYASKALNSCWYRFVVLKEVCQIYCDRKKGTSPRHYSINSLIYNLLDKFRKLEERPDIFEIDPSDENYTEFLAFYMAINLICPEHHRTNFNDLSNQIVQKTADHTFYDLAKIYKMPEYIVTLLGTQMVPFYNADKTA